MMNKNVTIGVLSLILAVAGIVVVLKKKDVPGELVTNGPVKIMSEPYPDGWAQGTTGTKILHTTVSGEVLHVEGTELGKEFQVFRVRTPTNEIGYVFSGDNFTEKRK